jgi:four helix bundle protein
MTKMELTALEKAHGMAVAALTLPVRDRSLRDQLRRSSVSVVLNLQEGAGRRGADRTHLWTVAYASAKEAQSAARLARDAGLAAREPADALLALLDAVAALTWRLVHPRR